MGRYLVIRKTTAPAVPTGHARQCQNKAINRSRGSRAISQLTISSRDSAIADVMHVIPIARRHYG